MRITETKLRRVIREEVSRSDAGRKLARFKQALQDVRADNNEYSVKLGMSGSKVFFVISCKGIEGSGVSDPETCSNDIRAAASVMGGDVRVTDPVSRDRALDAVANYEKNNPSAFNVSLPDDPFIVGDVYFAVDAGMAL